MRIVLSALLFLWIGSCQSWSASVSNNGERLLPKTSKTTPDSPLESHYWMFRNHHPIHYQVLPSTSESPKTILLLNGFGVGTFHQHNLMRQLQSQGTVYALDYLGQGKSWPADCQDGQGDNEKDLRYCAQMWLEQILAFLKAHDLTDVHIIGNSLGGHLAVYCAQQSSSRIASICLLNATPVWGANLPGWSGHLPAPAFPKAVGRFMFDIIRKPSTITQFLENCYVNEYDLELEDQIRACTDGAGGHAAFASILWSPPASSEPLEDTLAQVDQRGTPVLLIYGAQDPWCTPGIAAKLLSGNMRYVELSNVGHCPNNEAPVAVSNIWRQWQEGQTNLSSKYDEYWGTTTATEKEGTQMSTTWKDRIANALLWWNMLRTMEYTQLWRVATERCQQHTCASVDPLSQWKCQQLETNKYVKTKQELELDLFILRSFPDSQDLVPVFIFHCLEYMRLDSVQFHVKLFTDLAGFGKDLWGKPS